MDEAIGFEDTVGFEDCELIDFYGLREGANGGQLLAGRETTGVDKMLNAIAYLKIYGLFGLTIQRNFHPVSTH